MSRKRRPTTKLLLGAALAVVACYGQSFEVASIKATPPPSNGARFRVGSSGGPGTPDPGLYTCLNCSLSNLIAVAYELKPYQFPDSSSFGSDLFTVSAKVPPGTSREDFRIMQQNLLAERFKLKIHREKKEMQVYELVVGKNGPKLKELPEATVDALRQPFPPGGPKIGKDGFPEIPSGVSGTVMMNGKARWQALNQGVAMLTTVLSTQLGKPVTDATGLKGKYDLALFWAQERRETPPPSPETSGTTALLEGDSGPTLLVALQEQLGLRLEQKKGSVDIVVIDHVEKVPTEN